MVALGFAPSADKVIARIGQECDKLSGAQRAISDGGEDLHGFHFGHLVFRAGSSGLGRSILDVTNPASSPCEAVPKPSAARLLDERALMVVLGFAQSAATAIERFG